MKNLLDTHTILCFLNGERLTANTKERYNPIQTTSVLFHCGKSPSK